MIAVAERPRVAPDLLPLDHLRALTDHRGVFEHALHGSPRPEHGYCLDDVARGLVVTVRHEARGSEVSELVDLYLSFVDQAIVADGRAHNRRDARGSWTDLPGLGDWWGRAVLAVGFTTAHASRPAVRIRARAIFERAARQRSPALRAMASAAIGAAEVLSVDPASESARCLAVDGAAAVPDPSSGAWPWPEERLRYGNATIAEALIAAGEALGEPALVERGLMLLSFLLEVESRDGHLSVTGVAGRGPGDREPQFDQQPIELAAIADAAARAHRLGHGDRWAEVVRLAWGWFLGENDAGVPMVDLATGAGYDGLHVDGRNDNRGAESTLAALGTWQQVRAVPASGRP